MKRYREIPEIVEATQWHAGDPPLEGMALLPRPVPGLYYLHHPDGSFDPVHDGDWLVKHDGCWFTRISPDAFELYEPVEKP